MASMLKKTPPVPYITYVPYPLGREKPQDCNICLTPFLQEYRDPTSGDKEVIEVKCLGHVNLRPHLWSGHPEHRRAVGLERPRGVL